ncbi:hypothetical protein RFI_14199 [Reticulomyxa filosa]|uniref:Uncharacterized protein n=1 Tax=Reticulomyxa filosa TaxID=46433 RepID=X6NAE5_RETFI|nr:hypothetical protein RFI_14199 [Reticulomyxa filosa]|eukprot:ETO22986.1 hypothetical protein RFI_14199 [Reticulomyxa filosa]
MNNNGNNRRAFEYSKNIYLEYMVEMNNLINVKEEINNGIIMNHIFVIFSTTPGKLIFDSMDFYKGSHFTECFCNVISQNIIFIKPLKDNLRLISKSIKQKALIRQIIQTTTTCDRHVLLYNNCYYHLLYANVEIDQNYLWIMDPSK